MKDIISKGDSVIVKKGIVDPDYGNPIEGWTGVVVEKSESDNNEPLVRIQWDSRTLKQMSQQVIEQSETQGLDWTGMYLKMSDIVQTHSKVKENKQMVTRTIETISKKYQIDKIMDRNMIKSYSQEIKSSVKEKSFLVTATGEPYQLVRVYFSVTDQEKLLEAFSQLRCFVYSRNLKQWKWLYKDEAQACDFNKSCTLLSKETRPLILGTVQLETDTYEMFLNVISFERAIKGIVFFDRHIKRSYARVTDIEVVNKLFESSSPWIPCHNDYFDIHKIHKTLPEALINRLSMIESSTDNHKTRSALSYSYLEKMAREPLAEVERFPTYYYEDGIEKIQISLKMRYFIALQHWYGRTDYTFYDLSQEIISR